MVIRNGNPELAIRAVLEQLQGIYEERQTTIAAGGRKGIEGLNAEQLQINIAHADGFDGISNPYRCSVSLTAGAIKTLLQDVAIEYGSLSKTKTWLRITDKGRTILAKLRTGMTYDDSLQHSDVTAIVMEKSEARQRYHEAISTKTGIDPSIMIPDDARDNRVAMRDVAQVLLLKFGRNPKIAVVLEELAKRSERGEGNAL